MQAEDKLRVNDAKVQKHPTTSRQRYDKQARTPHAKPGQEVFRRNFVLCDFSKAFNAKFARKLMKARVVKAVWNNANLLEDQQGRKDIRL